MTLKYSEAGRNNKITWHFYWQQYNKYNPQCPFSVRETQIQLLSKDNLWYGVAFYWYCDMLLILVCTLYGVTPCVWRERRTAGKTDTLYSKPICEEARKRMKNNIRGKQWHIFENQPPLMCLLSALESSIFSSYSNTNRNEHKLHKSKEQRENKVTELSGNFVLFTITIWA